MNKEGLKAKWNNFCEFIKKHKKKIILATLAVGGVVTYVVLRKKLIAEGQQRVLDAASKFEEERLYQVSELAPHWTTGEVASIYSFDAEWSKGKELEIIVNDVKPIDMGKFGEDILKCDGVTDKSVVSTIAYVWEPKNK